MLESFHIRRQKPFLYIAVICFMTAALFCAPEKAVAQAFTVTTVNDIDIGTVEAPTSGGAGNLTIQPLGGIICPGGYVCPGIGVAGRIQVTGPTNRYMSISCEVSKTLRNTGGSGGGVQDMPATGFVVRHTGTGTEAACTGTANNVIFQQFSGNSANNQILVGMMMDASDPRFGGQYALANHAGGELIVRIREVFLLFGFIPIVTEDVNALVDAVISFQGILGIFAGSDMDFGEIEMTGAPGAGTSVSLGTNGTRQFAGNFSGTGSGTAGSVSFSGLTDGEMYEISCSQTATLTNASGTASIDVTGLEITHNNTPGSYGSATPCNGLATSAISGAYSAALGTTLLLGGVLDGATVSGTLTGTHSSGNPGGGFIEVQLIRP